MPFASSVAARGVFMQDATAPAPWTVPSVTSFLTGLLPSVHGSDAPLKAPRLLPAVTTYAEILRKSHGYQTHAFTAGPWFGGRQSILQGFEHGARRFTLQGASKILAGVAAKRDPSKPFFLFLHSYEAHDPYGKANHPWPEVIAQLAPRTDFDVSTVKEPWQFARHFFLSLNDRLDLLKTHGSRVNREVSRYVHSGYRDDPRPNLAAELRHAYEGGVAWVDTQLRGTVEQLAAWGMLENTVLVITSDHGEAFGEHGILAHGRQLYDELVRVPMVLAGPAPFDGGRSLAGGVGLHDLLPTFLEHVGGAPLEGGQGRSFLPLLKGQGQGRPVFSEEVLNRDGTGEDDDALLTSVRSSRWKYIITFDRLKGTVLEEAYDLAADPGEQDDLCKGSGRLDGLSFDAEFCAAIESARDRIWSDAGRSDKLFRSPYGGGRSQVTSQRPKPCR
jgi:arylsulfatase A-like enzyme